MPGLYARISVESDGNILTAANYNAEHDNHITNATPSQHDDYSTNVAQMQATTDPGEVGTESLATSQAGEFERLRHAIKEVKGTTQWYESPVTDLATLSTPSGGLHIGLEFEGALGGASTTTDVLAKLVNQGTIINGASYSTADVAVADFDATNKKFGSYSLILASGNVLAFPGRFGNPVKGSLSAWYRNLAAGDYIAYNPLLGIEVFLDSVSGRQTLKVTEKTAATESTKTTNQVQGSSTRSGDSSFAHVSAKWRLNDEAGASTDLLEMERNAADEGTQLSGQDLDVNPGDGGVWFFGAKRNEPTWDHFYAASGLPTAHSAAWTSNGTPNASVSNGVLNIATTGSNAGYFSRSGAPLAGVNLANQTLEFKLRLNSVDQRTAVSDDPMCLVNILDDSMNRGFVLQFFKTSMFLRESNSNTIKFECQIDTSKFHIYRLTTSGATNPIPSLYIDGQCVFIGDANTTSDPTANDQVTFGDTSTTASHNANIDIEWIAYADEIAAPVTASSQGNLDSIGVISSVISNTSITRLQTSKVTDVFNSVPSYGPTLPLISLGGRAGTLTTTSTTFEDVSSLMPYYVAGDGLTEYIFRCTIPISHGTAGGAEVNLGIDIDNDFTGLNNSTAYGSVVFTPSTANYPTSVTATRRVKLSVGLHTVFPTWKVTSGTGNVSDENEMIYECEIAKEGRLA